jgi:hypothetical protein
MAAAWGRGRSFTNALLRINETIVRKTERKTRHAVASFDEANRRALPVRSHCCRSCSRFGSPACKAATRSISIATLHVARRALAPLAKQLAPNGM